MTLRRTQGDVAGGSRDGAMFESWADFWKCLGGAVVLLVSAWLGMFGFLAAFGGK